MTAESVASSSPTASLRAQRSNPDSRRRRISGLLRCARNDGVRRLCCRPKQQLRTRPMQYRQLGHSGLKVSPICLGTMMFGGPTDEAASQRIIAKAHEAGINFIDTADAYSKGGSEEVVGRALGNNRHAWVLATKLANPMNNGMGNDPNRVGLSRRWVLQAADESLKRL